VFVYPHAGVRVEVALKEPVEAMIARGDVALFVD